MAEPLPLQTLPSSCSQPLQVSGHEADSADKDGYERFEAAKAQKAIGYATPLAGALVMANTLLGGSGLLGIPHAFAEAGWVVGLVAVAFFGCASLFGNHLLHVSARKIGQAPCSYYTVAQFAAPRATWLIDAAVAIKCFGVGTSYIIIVGDLLPEALNSFGWPIKRWEAITLGFAIGGPLACLKNLSTLRYTAFVAVLITIWTTLLILLFFLRASDAFEPCGDPTEPLPCDGEDFKMFPASALQFLKNLPVFVFGFTCHQNIFTVINEMKRATQTRVDGALVLAYVVSGTVFGTAAFLGSATYGEKINSDILKGYPQSVPVQVTRVLYSLLVMFSYPLQVHPSRQSIITLLKSLRGDTSTVAEPSPQLFWAITAIILAAAYATALSVTSLGLVLGIVGATGSTMVSYILPGLVYMKTFPASHMKRVFAMAQFTFGCIFMPVALTLTFVGGGGH